MLPFYLWFILAGLLLTIMALASTFLERLPLSASFVYLGAGVLVGPLGLGLLVFNPLDEFAVTFLERFSETVVVLSLFAAGLKMRIPLTDRLWRFPLRLALISMSVTVGLVTLIGVYLLGLPLGAAVLLGAVLAPTDPVLASDVQIKGTHDTDRLRFSLTGEAGFNDGTAFPFVMLGLGLMGLRDLGAYGWRWFAVDVVWAIAAGLAVGAVLGVLTGRLVIYLRRTHKEAVGLDDFLALGLVFLSYGLTLMISAYAFLAAFAAGYALRAVERHYSGDDDASENVVAAAQSAEAEDDAVDQDKAPAYMASAVLGFTEQFERIGTVGMVVLIGGLLYFANWSWPAAWFVAIMFLVVRPISVWIGLLGSGVKPVQRNLIAWFGIRGIGSVYYLMFAVHHGLPEGVGALILSLTLLTIAASAVLHGSSVTPLMNWYKQRFESG